MLRRVTLTALCFAGLTALTMPIASFADDAAPMSSMPEGVSARSLAKIARAKKRGQGKVTAQALKDVCKSTSPISMLWKPAWGGHIGNHDGRANGPAVLCNRRQCPKSWPAPVYYSDGKLAFKVGVYGTWNVTGLRRAYCAAGGAGGCSLRSAATQARAKGRDGKLYLGLGNKVCATVNSPLGRNGSPF